MAELTLKDENITNLNNQNEKYEKEILSLNNHNDEITEKYKLIKNELSESQNESKEILDQSKKHIEKMKKKFEIHQIDLIKRILEFVYIKYDENIKKNDNNENKFNYISFFRSITK